MKPNTKKISVFRESREIIRVRTSGRVLLFCALCGSDVNFLAFDEAARILGIGTRETFRKAETGELHSIEKPNGQMLVCARSLGINVAG